MGQDGGMCVPIVPCRLSQHIGGLGIARINDLGRVNRGIGRTRKSGRQISRISAADPLNISQIRENRLVAGINFLAELPPKLRHGVLLMKEKVARGATSDDAETLATYAGLVRGTNGYNSFVEGALS